MGTKFWWGQGRGQRKDTQEEGGHGGWPQQPHGYHKAGAGDTAACWGAEHHTLNPEACIWSH